MTPPPTDAPSETLISTVPRAEQAREVDRKAGTRVSTDNNRATRSWNELRVEIMNMTLDVADAGGSSIILRANQQGETTSARYRDALDQLIAHGGDARILDPNGSGKDVRLV